MAMLRPPDDCRQSSDGAGLDQLHNRNGLCSMYTTVHFTRLDVFHYTTVLLWVSFWGWNLEFPSGLLGDQGVSVLQGILGNLWEDG
ncbi:uncharacterized protein SETTUDRAFT_166229 [Exserohilum turcica Et28A]|uniref:Uncharacterized protein n=1 Tax=Exserohilum turcicum (strain 28A) TaxID=671987 RepID=R0I569_EXST2|nr:uncharacterized protein SETTUDRAFT_166229 [Exserohilum turcica Et28A]EOA80805.1 hypothetical protein SETTUDRAFT_166229 [Exserohilum turcica Et28A]